MNMYILVDKMVVAENNTHRWGKWMETGDRTVAKTEVGKVLISTVFLGMDHRFDGEGGPILFETMVFPSGSWADESEYTRRYETWEQAEQGHAEVVIEVRAG